MSDELTKLTKIEARKKALVASRNVNKARIRVLCTAVNYLKKVQK